MRSPSRWFLTRWILAAGLAGASVVLLPFLGGLWALADGDKKGPEAASPGKTAGHPLDHSDNCAGCSADLVWKGFLDHLRATGRSELIPPDALPTGEGDETKPPVIDLLAGDPLKGVLFKVSPDLVNLDAIMAEDPGASGRPEKARTLATKLGESEDPYLKAYGIFHGARLDFEAGSTAPALKALEGLVESCHFLPRREARRWLAQAYSAAGDDTLALLELRFFMADSPAENEADLNWAKEELKKVRDKGHPGPLHHSEESMRSISTLLAGLDVGAPTQENQRRVEDILDKVAKLLERPGGT
ncbi:MAG TPA: hypothetical protein VMT52_12145 [Planctomycetota bacterium]|nr:hypothetical protein [Planctomycetota bacterium]